MSSELLASPARPRWEVGARPIGRWLPALLSALLIAWLLVFIAYPVVAVLAKSLETKGGEFTLEHYRTFFVKPYFLRSLANTLVLGITVTLACTALGFGLASLVVRGPRALRLPLRTLTLAPLIAPPYLFGLALIILAGRRGILAQLLGSPIPLYGWLGVITSQLLSLLPVAFLLIENILLSLDPHLEDSAADLGAGEVARTRTIVLPLVAPGLLKAALLVFGLAIADFGNPALLGGNLSFLAPDAFMMVTGEWNLPMASAISVILLVPTLGIYLLQHYWLQGRAYTTVGGASSAAERRPLGGGMLALCLVPAGLYVLAVIACYAVIVLGAFTRLVGIDNSFTIQHLVRNIGLESIRTSFEVSLLAGILAAGLGTALAYVVARTEVMGRRALELITLVGFALPGTVMGIGYILTFNRAPLLLTGTAAILTLNMMARFLAVGLEAGTSKLAQIDTSLEEASADLGAGRLTTFRRITLPLMSSAFVAGFLFTFMQSMISLSAVIFLVAPGNLLASVYIFNRVRDGDTGIACATSLVLILSLAACLAGLGALARRSGFRLFTAHD